MPTAISKTKARTLQRDKTSSKISSASDLQQSWALLGRMDGLRLASVKSSLEKNTTSGSRYFCALRRAVPLHQQEDAQREANRIENEVGVDEVWPTEPKRQWVRKLHLESE